LEKKFKPDEQIFVVNLLLKTGVIDHFDSVTGKTALIYSCANGAYDIVEMLLRQGANLHIMDKVISLRWRSA
jgi:ankyrin repeat protein